MTKKHVCGVSFEVVSVPLWDNKVHAELTAMRKKIRVGQSVINAEMLHLTSAND